MSCGSTVSKRCVEVRSYTQIERESSYTIPEEGYIEIPALDSAANDQFMPQCKY